MVAISANGGGPISKRAAANCCSGWLHEKKIEANLIESRMDGCGGKKMGGYSLPGKPISKLVTPVLREIKTHSRENRSFSFLKIGEPKDEKAPCQIPFKGIDFGIGLG